MRSARVGRWRQALAGSGREGAGGSEGTACGGGRKKKRGRTSAMFDSVSCSVKDKRRRREMKAKREHADKRNQHTNERVQHQVVKRTRNAAVGEAGGARRTCGR